MMPLIDKFVYLVMSIGYNVDGIDFDNYTVAEIQNSIAYDFNILPVFDMVGLFILFVILKQLITDYLEA